MLITPDKLKLAKYLDKNNQKQALDNLLLNQNKAVVCNGHYLIQVEDTPPLCEDFPIINSIENTDYIPNKILITASTATKVLKNMPKNKNLPIINNTLIEVDKNSNINLGLTDLNSSIVIQQRGKDYGKYPDTDIFIEDNTKNEPKAKVDINVKYLQKITNALSEFLNDHETTRVEITLRGPENAIVLQCKKDDVTMTALIMPLRIDHKNGD